MVQQEIGSLTSMVQKVVMVWKRSWAKASDGMNQSWFQWNKIWCEGERIGVADSAKGKKEKKTRCDMEIWVKWEKRSEIMNEQGLNEIGRDGWRKENIWKYESVNRWWLFYSDVSPDSSRLVVKSVPTLTISFFKNSMPNTPLFKVSSHFCLLLFLTSNNRSEILYWFEQKKEKKIYI